MTQNISESKPVSKGPPLRSAVEIAVLDTPPPDATPTTSDFLKRMRERKRPGWREVLPENHEGKLIITSPETIAAVLFNSGEGATVAAPEDVEKLRHLQARIEAILEEMKKWSLANVSSVLHQQRDDIAAAVEKGLSTDGMPSQSREAVNLDFNNRLSALNKFLVKLTAEELVPLAKPILERFEKAVEEFMRQREISDRELAIAFGIEYKPCILWKAGAAVVQRFIGGRKLPTAHSWVTPRTLLEGIIDGI